MPSGRYIGIAVPFTVEEIENLTALAEAQGASIVEFIRARVFGPWDGATKTSALEEEKEEDLTSMIARLEGMRIRARCRRRE